MVVVVAAATPLQWETGSSQKRHIMRKTYKYKGQNQKNTIKLGNMLDDMWQIHVHIMRLARRYYRMFGKNLSAYRLKAHVTKLKKTTKPHWAALPSQVVQDVVLRYGKSQDAFFQNIASRKSGKTTRKVGRPKIKPRHKYNSMTFTQAGYKLEGNRIKINCIDTWFSFHKHREIKGVIKTITIKRDRCGDYWICFSCENVEDSEPKPKTGNTKLTSFVLFSLLRTRAGTETRPYDFG